MLRYRGSISETLNKSDCLAYGLERFKARVIAPIETCYEERRGYQIYICAFGMRYGSIDEHTQKLYTQLEYEKAEFLGIPILVFGFDEDKVQFSVKDIDICDSVSRLLSFKERTKNTKRLLVIFLLLQLSWKARK
ncbi:MAG: DUF4062 domain-containing protein [Lachnospiraceae bacterium]|nr:DUF4062 domain-containing protein [Lachnospiraceae bacterium]